MTRFQFIWWMDPRDWCFRRFGPWPPNGPNRGLIFRWMVRIGPLEIRRWEPLKQSA